jgi:hypothetical protein
MHAPFPGRNGRRGLCELPPLRTPSMYQNLPGTFPQAGPICANSERGHLAGVCISLLPGEETPGGGVDLEEF